MAEKHLHCCGDPKMFTKSANISCHEVVGPDQMVTSRRRILLPRRWNFAGESIKNLHLLSIKLYILGNVSAPMKNICDIIMSKLQEKYGNRLVSTL